MDDLLQIVAEARAHYGPGGPAAASREWLTRVLLDGDLASAWPLTDPDYRELLVCGWINQLEGPLKMRVGRHLLDDPDGLAEAIQHMGPEHRFWRFVAPAVVAAFRMEWPDFDLETWGNASRPRPVGIDLEQVVWVETGGEILVATEADFVGAMVVQMRHSDGAWRMAGINP